MYQLVIKSDWQWSDGDWSKVFDSLVVWLRLVDYDYSVEKEKNDSNEKFEDWRS